jgi:hypothetical protein
MKPWFSFILVCWALLFLLFSLSQQAGLNHLLLVTGSGQWLAGCREPESGSPTASVRGSMELAQARAAPLESVVFDSALTADSTGQEIDGPPQSLGPWRVAGQSRQLKAIIKSPFSEITGSTDRICRIGVLQQPLLRIDDDLVGSAGLEPAPSCL